MNNQSFQVTQKIKKLKIEIFFIVLEAVVELSAVVLALIFFGWKAAAVASLVSFAANLHASRVARDMIRKLF